MIDKEFVKEKAIIAVLTAFMDGKAVQVRNVDCEEEEWDTINWNIDYINFDCCEYRVAKDCPYNSSSMKDAFLNHKNLIYNASKDCYTTINAFDGSVVTATGSTITYEELFNDWTWADNGERCANIEYEYLHKIK